MRSLFLALSLLLAAAAPAPAQPLLHPYNVRILSNASVIDWLGKPALVLWSHGRMDAAWFTASSKDEGGKCNGWPLPLTGVQFVPLALLMTDTRPCTFGSMVYQGHVSGSSNSNGHWSLARMGPTGFFFGALSNALPLKWDAIGECMRNSTWHLSYCMAGYERCDQRDPCKQTSFYGPEFWALVCRVELL